MELIKTRYSKVKIEDQTKLLIDNLWDTRSFNEVEKKIEEIVRKIGLNIEYDKIDLILLPAKKIIVKKDSVDYEIVNSVSNANDNSSSTPDYLDLILYKLTSTLKINIKKNNSTLLIILDGNESDEITTSSAEINIKEGISTRAFEIWIGSTQNYLLNSLSFVISEGSSLKFLLVDDTKKSKVIQRKSFILMKNAELHGGNIWSGESKNLIFEDIILDGEAGCVQDYHLCIGKDKAQLEINHKVQHVSESTRGFVSMKGVLYDSAEINFLAYAKVGNNAKNSDSYVEGKSIIMSDRARSYIVPSMEIATNVVKAKHAASVSRISDNEMFYIMTRGMEEEEAKKLILEGFIRDILSKFPEPEDVESFIPKFLAPLLPP